MRKAQPLLYKDRPIVVWKKFNDAFVFYARHPIPVLNDTAALDLFLREHRDVLVISDTKNQELLKNRDDLELIRKDREIFNSHTSRIYRQKAVERPIKEKY